MKILVNTGGGDAPGLNAVIRAVVLASHRRRWEVWGVRRGYEGLWAPGGLIRLTPESVRGITHLGGTVLGTVNHGNPFGWPASQPEGTVSVSDRSGEVLGALRSHGFAGLIAIGGDGSLHIASRLHDLGLPVIGVPKTIDNDLLATTVTFGFGTAVQTATDAIDKLHPTTQAHRRVMVVELMGRHTGWIALHAGIAGTADVILIPEIPYDLERVCAKIEDRYRSDSGFAIIVAAEGAFPRGGGRTLRETAGPGRAARYGGVAEKLASEIGRRTGRETRSIVLGHLQRGGPPTAEDRLLALRLGTAAVECAGRGDWGCMVAIAGEEVSAVPLREAVEGLKMVPADGDLVRTARALGVSFGD